MILLIQIFAYLNQIFNELSSIWNIDKWLVWQIIFRLAE
jgi:hypothetical protein